MGYGKVTSSVAHFQRNMAFPGGILSAPLLLCTILATAICRVGNGRRIKTGYRRGDLGQVISSLWVPVSSIVKWIVGGHWSWAPSWSNFPRLLVLDWTDCLILPVAAPACCPLSELGVKHPSACESYFLRVWMEATIWQVKSAHLPRALLSWISNPALMNPPCTSLTPSQAQQKVRGRTIFALGDDNDGSEFLLTACEVSGPTLNALLAFPHLILTKTLLHMHNRWGNRHVKRWKESPKTSQLECSGAQDVNLGLSDTTLSFKSISIFGISKFTYQGISLCPGQAQFTPISHCNYW